MILFPGCCSSISLLVVICLCADFLSFVFVLGWEVYLSWADFLEVSLASSFLEVSCKIHCCQRCLAQIHFLCWWWVSQIILKESFLAVKRAFFWSTLQTWFSKMSGRCGQDEDLLILCLNLNLHNPSISHLNYLLQGVKKQEEEFYFLIKVSLFRVRDKWNESPLSLVVCQRSCKTMFSRLRFSKEHGSLTLMYKRMSNLS